MALQQFEHLRHLFGAYFHQDWDLEGKDWPDLIHNYRRDTPAVEAAAAAEEIERLLAENGPEATLVDRLLEFGCYYAPRQDLGGPSVREWLVQVAEALRTWQGPH